MSEIILSNSKNPWKKAVAISFSFHAIIFGLTVIIAKPEHRKEISKPMTIDVAEVFQNDLVNEPEKVGEPEPVPEVIETTPPEVEIPDDMFLEEVGPVSPNNQVEVAEAPVVAEPPVPTEVPQEPVPVVVAYVSSPPTETFTDSTPQEVAPGEPINTSEVSGTPSDSTVFGVRDGSTVAYSGSDNDVTGNSVFVLPKGNPQGMGVSFAASTRRESVTKPSSSGANANFTPVHRLSKLPVFAKRIEPVYPESERAAGVETKVVAEVYVNKTGVVEDVLIVKSGGEIFDQSVIVALMASSFQPGMINEKPVAAKIRVPIVFNLN